MRILEENTMAIFIDMQTKLLPSIKDKGCLMEQVEKLAAGLRLLETSCMVTEQYPAGLGATQESLLNKLANCPIYPKITFSAYETIAIKNAIENTNKKNIILCGTEAHVCVLQTLIDLCQAGFRVILVEDCIGSRKEKDKVCALRRAQQEGAILTTCEALLFELTRAAGDKRFKEMLKIIK